MSIDPFTVTIGKSLDVYTAPDVRDRLRAAVSRYARVTVDLEATQFMDASGLGVLLSAHRLAKTRDCEMVLTGVSEPIMRVFERTGVTGALKVREQPARVMGEAPARTLRRAATLMRERTIAVEIEMADPENRYWGGTGAARYRTGVRGGLGGASGNLAAQFDPDAVRAIADWLEEVAADRHRDLPLWVESGALAIARAYLGEAEAPSHG